ncbi:YgaP-like transmembrane domain [Bacillus massiliglaciei]|uniref:YgaP-like transmembrane domain n=1 Tax=Bacillus massiliglaciei TaxID=1816693 RepID=UPI000DA5EDB2|nr:YgaP-like transmembrane domain [Bacillus massiliglaciei]
MQFKQNISTMNALVRMTCGFTMLACTTAKMARKSHKDSYILIAALSAMKIGEGILRYCPLTDAMESGGKSQKMSHGDDLADSLGKQMEDFMKKES